MNIRILLIVLALLAISCSDNGGREQAMSRDEVSYLEAVVPPCADNEGSGQELCATDIPDLETVSIQGAIPFWPVEEGDPPTFTDLLLGASLLTGVYHPRLAPHIAVRGIAKPNSIRCDVYPMFRPEREMLDDLYIGLFHYLCFMDITINEYLVGTGPAGHRRRRSAGVVSGLSGRYLSARTDGNPGSDSQSVAAGLPIRFHPGRVGRFHAGRRRHPPLRAGSERRRSGRPFAKGRSFGLRSAGPGRG